MPKRLIFPEVRYINSKSESFYEGDRNIYVQLINTYSEEFKNSKCGELLNLNYNSGKYLVFIAQDSEDNWYYFGELYVQKTDEIYELIDKVIELAIFTTKEE